MRIPLFTTGTFLSPGTEVRNDPAPQPVAFASEIGIRGRLGDRRVHHHQFQLRVDEDRLPENPEKREAWFLAGKNPRLISIAEVFAAFVVHGAWTKLRRLVF